MVKAESYGRALDGTWVATMMKDKTSGWKVVSIVGNMDVDFEVGEDTDEEQEMHTKAQRADDEEAFLEHCEDIESNQESKEDDDDDKSMGSEQSDMN